MEATKLIAIYYPQFHSIPENDKAWGKGFTDWNNVKIAKPQYKGHKQPKIPLNDNYYLLSNSEVIAEQVKLAKAKGIDAFCFYHYWFDGKLLLEKPLEDFLHNKALDIDFCLSWANETWSKRWIGSQEIIQEQTHKEDSDIWEKHFYYLLSFFKDKRYIKIENKPYLLIYQPSIIKGLSPMLKLWRELAIKEGFDGIYLVATKRHDYLPSTVKEEFNAIMKFQPQEVYNSPQFQGKNPLINRISNYLRFLPESIINFLYHYRSKFSGVKIYDSEEVWAQLIKNAYKPIHDFKGDIFESIYVNWDNTPRYRNKATIFSHIEPDNFGRKLSNILQIAQKNHSPYLFINAWNEWAEGAYLEPDTLYGYQYLDIIKKIKKSIKL